MSQRFKANLTNIMPTEASAGPVNRWWLEDFYDKVLIAQATVAPHFWPGSGDARPIPGLPDATPWDGVTVVGQHPVLWRGDELLIGATNDYTTWIPIAASASTARAPTKDAFTQPEAGAETGWIRLDDPDDVFIEGQYVRIDIDSDSPEIAYFNFYQVVGTSDSTGSQATHAPWAVTVAKDETVILATEEFLEFTSKGYLAVDGVVTELRIDGSNTTPLFSSALTADAGVPPLGATTKVKLTDPGDLAVGDLVSISSTQLEIHRNVYEVTKVDGVEITVKRLGIGTDQKDTGLFTASSPTFYVTRTPWIKVTNTGSGNVIVGSESLLGGTSAIKLKNLGYTGSLPTGSQIPSGSIVDSMLGNSAAYLINAGADINGDIYAIVNIGEYGFILKQNSIQSMQVIDAPGVPFAIRTEVTKNGPLSRNAWCSLHVENQVQGIFFVGKNDLFKYSGGQMIEPILRQHSAQFFNELDRSRADEITCQQFPHLRQVWVAYPQKQSVVKRVLIYNYEDNSVTLDDYDEELGGLSALGLVDWEIAPTWNDLLDTQLWNLETKRWFEYSDEGEKQHTLIGVRSDAPNEALGDDPTADGVPRLLLHGRGFYRLSSADCRGDHEGAYVSLAETHDFDFGDESRFKYTDHVELAADVDGGDPGVPCIVYVQLGSRANRDDEIRWSAPSPVDLRGSRNRVTKVAARVSGRYIRMRIYSDEADAQWRISRYTIVGRLGGTY